MTSATLAARSHQPTSMPSDGPPAARDRTHELDEPPSGTDAPATCVSSSAYSYPRPGPPKPNTRSGPTTASARARAASRRSNRLRAELAGVCGQGTLDLRHAAGPEGRHHIWDRQLTPQPPEHHLGRLSSRLDGVADRATVTSWPWWPSWGDGPTSSRACSAALRRDCRCERALGVPEVVIDSDLHGGICDHELEARELACPGQFRPLATVVLGRPRAQAKLTTRQPASRSPISVAGAPKSSSSGCGETPITTGRSLIVNSSVSPSGDRAGGRRRGRAARTPILVARGTRAGRLLPGRQFEPAQRSASHLPDRSATRRC